MSLAIDVDDVTAVLLADGWHDVADDSFDLDSYEYLHLGDLLLGGGSVDGVPSTGFRFVGTDGANMAGPITAVLAVKRD